MPQEDPVLPIGMLAAVALQKPANASETIAAVAAIVQIGFGFILLHTMKPVAELVSRVDMPVSTVG